jgi:hypothetical protein
MCNCGGHYHRVRQEKVLPSNVEDCRDALSRVAAQCSKCRRGRRVPRDVVAGGKLTIDEFNKLQAKHGWPVPGSVFA